MTHSERMSAALGLDKVVPDQCLICKGINVYPLVRLSLFIHLIREDYSYKHTIGKRRYEFITSVLNFYFKGYFRRPSNKHTANTLFLSYSTFRRNPIEGKWFDLYADSFIINKNITKYRFVEVPQRGIYKKERFSESVYLNPLVQLMGRIVSRLTPVKVEGNQWKNAIAYCNNLGYNVTETYFENKVSEIGFYKNYLKRKYITNEIESVVCTSFSMNFSMAIMWAANEENIETCELQHGSIYSDSPYYCHWHGVDSPLLPNTFYVWSNEQASYINETNRGYPQAIADGNGFHKALKLGSFDFSDYDVLWQEYCNDTRVILIALQRDDLPTWLLHHLKKLNINGWTIILRPHPGLNNTKVITNLPNISALLKLRGVYLFEFDSIPLFYLLSKVELLLAGKSTTLIEACLFSLNSIIIVNDGLEYFKEQLDKGCILLGYTDELFKCAMAKLTLLDD